ncbi:MAG: cation:proton antiporter [Gemmatimonadaceae bacterium]
MTRTAFTSAIPGIQLARRFATAAFVCISVTASGQGRRTTTPPPTAGPSAPALWDALYSQHRLFELRDSVRAWHGDSSATTQFYKGVVAHAFNDNDGAISTLAPLLASTPPRLAPSQFIAAVDALSDSYRRVFRYRESAMSYRAALNQRHVKLDTAARARFTAWATIDETLATVSPIRVTWSAVANNATVANDSVAYAIAAVVNGDTLAAPLAVDASAPLSVLDATTAARLRIRILKDSVGVNLPGTAVQARIGVIDRLDIGSAHVQNVVVLIVPSATLRASYGGASLGGVIGRRVLSALGSVTFLRDGQVALSSPGADPDTSGLTNLALTSAGALVETIWQGKRVPLLLDAHANQTLLYPGFLKVFPAATADARLATYIGRAVDGEVVSLPSYLLPQLSLTVANTPVNLVGIHALMRDADPRAANYLGALGQDALRTADRITLDFVSMTVRFRPAPPVTVLPRIVYPSAVVGGASQMSKVPEDIAFVVLLFALFVIPKALQRYRLASAVTSLLMGAAATALGLFHNDPTLHLLSTFGIVALFLFAGLEIDGHELKRQSKPLMLHGLVWSVLLAVGAAVATFVFGFAVRPALLLALALLTPSTGFILSSLAGFGLLDSERFAVKTYAIASELLALMVLFFVLQSTSALHLAMAVAAMLGVVTVIPLAFRLFARVVAPHAPRSEFAFLLMVAIVCAYATRRLGVYYLVGAFLVGIAAQRFRSELPAMSSEKMVDALESFGSVFIPFYFFHAGTQIVREQLTLRAMLIGLALVVLLIPLRIAITTLQRRFVLKDSGSAARRIGIALIPTLVFTLVITDILNTEFRVEQYLLGALVLYTVINTSIPAFALHSAPPEFENVEAADIN